MTVERGTTSRDQWRSLGDFIRTQRKQRGWNQTRLGQEVGVDQTTVSTWERGESLPSDLHRLAGALNVPVEELVDRAFGFLTRVERAIVHDRLLPTEKQNI